MRSIMQNRRKLGENGRRGRRGPIESWPARYERPIALTDAEKVKAASPNPVSALIVCFGVFGFESFFFFFLLFLFDSRSVAFLFYGVHFFLFFRFFLSNWIRSSFVGSIVSRTTLSMTDSVPIDTRYNRLIDLAAPPLWAQL